MSANGRPCPTCGQWIGNGMGHTCTFTIPAAPGWPLNDPMPKYPTYQAPLYQQFVMPITLEDIRRVVREEMEAALTKALGAPTAVASADSATLPHQEK